MQSRADTFAAKASISSAIEKPTRARFIVLLYLCSLAFILYLDRICMGQAAKPIQDELDLTKTDMSYIHMAFTLAYGLFEIPTGRWGDRIGSRRVLARIVLWWSVFTALTGSCTTFYSLVFVRFLFGAGEAGAYPNVARVVARWFPLGERGRVQGLLLASSLVGGAVAPVLAGYLIEGLGWRWTFHLFGLIGVVWTVVFLAWFRDNPATHPAVNAAELSAIMQANSQSDSGLARSHRIPWKSALTNRNIWLLGVNISCAAFTSYLYFSWYPTYLREARGLDIRTAGWLVALVLGAAALGILAGGFVADFVARRGSVRHARRLHGFVSNSSAAALLYAGCYSDNPYLAACLTAASSFCMQSQQPIWWSSAIEISGRHIGALFGLLNMMGCFGAMNSQYFFGAFADWRKGLGFTGRAQWDPAIMVCAALLAVGALCWLFVDLTRRIKDHDETLPDVPSI